MTSTNSLSFSDVMNTTTTLHAELMTAKDSSDPLIIHASIISAVEGLLTCVRSIAAELVKVELEGIDSSLP